MKNQPEFIHCFAGNYMNGEVRNRTVMADAVDVEEVTDELLDSVGWDFGIWARYDGRNPIDVCKKDFADYMEYRAKCAESEAVLVAVG